MVSFLRTSPSVISGNQAWAGRSLVTLPTRHFWPRLFRSCCGCTAWRACGIFLLLFWGRLQARSKGVSRWKWSSIVHYKRRDWVLCTFFCVVCGSLLSVLSRAALRDLLRVYSVAWLPNCRLASSWGWLAFLPTSLAFLPKCPPFLEARYSGTSLCISFHPTASWASATSTLPALSLPPSFPGLISSVPSIVTRAFLAFRCWVARIWPVFTWAHSSVTSFLLSVCSGTLPTWSCIMVLAACTPSRITCNSVLPSLPFPPPLSWPFASLRITSSISRVSLVSAVRAAPALSLSPAVPASSSSIDTPRSSFSSPLAPAASLSRTLMPSWFWSCQGRTLLCWTSHWPFFRPLLPRNLARRKVLLFFLEARSPSFWWVWVFRACVPPLNLQTSKSTFRYLPPHPYWHIWHLNFPWNLVDNAVDRAL